MREEIVRTNVDRVEERGRSGWHVGAIAAVDVCDDDEEEEEEGEKDVSNDEEKKAFPSTSFSGHTCRI